MVAAALLLAGIILSGCSDSGHTGYGNASEQETIIENNKRENATGCIQTGNESRVVAGASGYLEGAVAPENRTHPPPQRWSVTSGPDPGMLTVRDMLGRTVVVPELIERVIALRAGALRMLSYLDAVDLVAGIEEPERRSDRPYLTAYPQLRDLPPVGPHMGGDPELLVAARPDLIFLTFTSRGQADDLQTRTGIPVIALEYGNFSDERELFFSSLRLMAALTDRTDRADSLIAGINASITELALRTCLVPDDERPRVYVGGVSYRGPRGINSTEPFYPPFRFINARNLAGDLPARLINPIQGTYIDIEQLIVWDPDVLFMDLLQSAYGGSGYPPGHSAGTLAQCHPQRRGLRRATLQQLRRQLRSHPRQRLVCRHGFISRSV
jgi:ABC-type Fe3+-hydroxamate transport system substrate-binding protein